MTIEIQECNGVSSSRDFLQDLGKYKTVPDWIEAVAKKETAFCPLDCFVSTDGKNRFGVVIAGQVSTQNLTDLRAAFKAVPKDLLRIPTDTMKIRADIFEQELFISLV